MGNLYNHAKTELELLGEDPDTTKGLLRVVSAFAKMGHSGGSAMIAISMIEKLLKFENLTPLTNNPAEWFHHGEDVWGEPGGIWQNVRNSECFSTDAGKTYYKVTVGRDVVHTSDEYLVGA